MTYTLCFVPYALWPTSYGQRLMAHVLWATPDGLDRMPYAICCMPFASMVYALCPMPYALLAYVLWHGLGQ